MSVKRRLLAIAAVALFGALSLALIPYERDLSATGRNGIEVDIDISVSCPAALVGAFESDETSGGWFNFAPNNGVAGGGLCRSSARWRLSGAVVLAFGGVVAMRRGVAVEQIEA